MKNKSLGLIETWGYVPAIEAADAGTKAAVVILLDYEITRTALVTVKFAGDVAAVQAAVSAGTAAAKKVGKVVGFHVIPRPDPQLNILPEDPTPLQIKKAGKSINLASIEGGSVEDKIKVETSPSIKESAQTPKKKVSLIKKAKETPALKPSARSKRVKEIEKPAPGLKKRVGKPKKKETTSTA